MGGLGTLPERLNGSGHRATIQVLGDLRRTDGSPTDGRIPDGRTDRPHRMPDGRIPDGRIPDRRIPDEISRAFARHSLNNIREGLGFREGYNKTPRHSADIPLHHVHQRIFEVVVFRACSIQACASFISLGKNAHLPWAFARAGPTESLSSRLGLHEGLQV